MPQKLDRSRPHCASSAAQDKLVRTSSAIFQWHSKTSAGNVVTEPEHTRGRYMLHSEWERNIHYTKWERVGSKKNLGGGAKMNKPQKFQREFPVLQVTFSVVNTWTNTQQIRRRGLRVKIKFSRNFLSSQNVCEETPLHHQLFFSEIICCLYFVSFC